jgi:hypothetical protein
MGRCVLHRCSPCTDFELNGLDPSPILGAGKDQLLSGDSVYEYSSGLIYGGIATVTVTNLGCVDGDTGLINVMIPMGIPGDLRLDMPVYGDETIEFVFGPPPL